MSRAFLALVMVLGSISWLVAAPASAVPRPYRGPHPLDLEGHWHDEGSVHVHDDLPAGLDGYAQIDGVYVFLADPVAFGFTGATWTFRGAHPLPAQIGGVCGVGGEHRHPFVPEGEYRRDENGTYAFVGALRGGDPTYGPGRVTPREGAVAPAPPASAVVVAPGLGLCTPDLPPGFPCTPVIVDVEVRRPPAHPPQPHGNARAGQSSGPAFDRRGTARRPRPRPPTPWPI
jgi:hypothetical protein